MLSDTLPPLAQVLDDYEIPFDDFVLVILHGVTTEDPETVAEGARALVQVLQDAELHVVVIHPNNDPGCDEILAAYEPFADDPRVRIFPSVRFEAFLTLLRHSRALIGNSSAGIREASFLGVPSVNIGTRQAGRERGPNVRDVTYETEAIRDAIAAQVAHGRFPSTKLYGDGEAGSRIAAVIATAPLTAHKRLTY
jgi:UDP-N-acetylglucosamine 2-epimerase (hydrolysing)